MCYVWLLERVMGASDGGASLPLLMLLLGLTKCTGLAAFGLAPPPLLAILPPSARSSQQDHHSRGQVIDGALVLAAIAVPQACLRRNVCRCVRLVQPPTSTSKSLVVKSTQSQEHSTPAAKRFGQYGGWARRGKRRRPRSDWWQCRL